MTEQYTACSCGFCEWVPMEQDDLRAWSPQPDWRPGDPPTEGAVWMWSAGDDCEVFSLSGWEAGTDFFCPRCGDKCKAGGTVEKRGAI